MSKHSTPFARTLDALAISQTEIAPAFGVSVRTIRRWCSGATEELPGTWRGTLLDYMVARQNLAASSRGALADGS